MKYLIADFVTEYDVKYENLKNLLNPFEYTGERDTEIKLDVSGGCLVQMKLKH